MVYKSISFNLDWVKGKTEAEFIAQFLDAFNTCDHPIARLSKAERTKWLKDAFIVLNKVVVNG